jgi:hypothetical protein
LIVILQEWVQHTSTVVSLVSPLIKHLARSHLGFGLVLFSTVAPALIWALMSHHNFMALVELRSPFHTFRCILSRFFLYCSRVRPHIVPVYILSSNQLLHIARSVETWFQGKTRAHSGKSVTFYFSVKNQKWCS